MKIVHINKDFDKVEAFARQLMERWDERDRKKAEKKYFKIKAQESKQKKIS